MDHCNLQAYDGRLSLDIHSASWEFEVYTRTGHKLATYIDAQFPQLIQRECFYNSFSNPSANLSYYCLTSSTPRPDSAVPLRIHNQSQQSAVHKGSALFQF